MKNILIYLFVNYVIIICKWLVVIRLIFFLKYVINNLKKILDNKCLKKILDLYEIFREYEVLLCYKDVKFLIVILFLF